MKITKVLILSMLVAFALIAFAACGGSGTEEATEPETTAAETEATAAPTYNGGQYGYAGTDPVEGAAYEYMVDEIADEYYGADDDDGVVSVPVVKIVKRVDNEDGSSDLYGDFQIYNYKVEGDTLKCISGGDHPGKMHVVKEENDDDADDNDYEVVNFEQVADGSEFEPTAKKIFGDSYDDFAKFLSDDKAKEEARAEALAVYVKTMGLKVTKYQDEGWDPIELAL